MLPFDEDSQKVPRITKRWTGDCWKAFVQLRFERADLCMKVIDTDCGVGIIKKGHQITLESLVTNYVEFDNDRKSIMNVISVEEFVKQY